MCFGPSCGLRLPVELRLPVSSEVVITLGIVDNFDPAPPRRAPPDGFTHWQNRQTQGSMEQAEALTWRSELAKTLGISDIFGYLRFAALPLCVLRPVLRVCSAVFLRLRVFPEHAKTLGIVAKNNSPPPRLARQAADVQFL